ncbi:MAG: hypothetical protein ACTSQY_02315 [Candidatus Odinarchaeia archaeon]
MIQHVVLFDKMRLNPITSYSKNGEIKTEDLTQLIGLVALLNKTIEHLQQHDLIGQDRIINLKTGKNTFSLKLNGNIIITVKGTSEKENQAIIDKIVNERIIDFY